jgi:hypothetical protein
MTSWVHIFLYNIQTALFWVVGVMLYYICVPASSGLTIRAACPSEMLEEYTSNTLHGARTQKTRI